jgi:hypothetical protein
VAANPVDVQPTSPGFFTAYPGGTARPLTSALNYNTGQIRANNAILPIGVAGDVAVFCGQGLGTAHLIVDVNGYFR